MGFEIFNLLNVRVLEEGFELDGKVMDENKMWRFVREVLDLKPRLPR